MRWAVFALFAFWTVVAKGAEADDRSIKAKDQSHPERHVSLVVAADEATGADFEYRLGELVHRLDVSLTATHVSAIDPHAIVFGPVDSAMIRVWIDASHSELAVVYLEDQRRGHLLVRKIELLDGIDEIAREQIGQIVRASVEALLSGGTIGISRAEAASALGLSPPMEQVGLPTTTTPATAATSRSRMTFGTGYAASLFTGHDLTTGPAARFTFSRVAGSSSFGGALAFEYRLPVMAATSPIELRLHGWSARLLACMGRSFSDRLAWQLGLGGGVDATYPEPRSVRGSEVRLLSPAASLSPALRAEVGLELALWRRLHAAVALTGDWDLAPRDYVVREDGDRSIIAHPLAVRPGLVVRIAADLSR